MSYHLTPVFVGGTKKRGTLLDRNHPKGKKELGVAILGSSQGLCVGPTVGISTGGQLHSSLSITAFEGSVIWGGGKGAKRYEKAPETAEAHNGSGGDREGTVPE